MNYLENFYENYDEDARLRCRHGMVEFLTTMRFIEKYLKPNSRIIEIGAGTGRYSHALAQAGYSVDAVELVPHNIEIFRRHTQEGEKITVRQGNALNLSDFACEQYDITLLLGPMYHLYTEQDQTQALSEAVRVTKKGGIIFAAYCLNDFTIIREYFGKNFIKNEHYKNLVDCQTFKAKSNPEDIFQLYRREDIDALTQKFSLCRLHYVGTDMVTKYMQDTVDEMDDEIFAAYLQYHFYICERKDMVGISSHALDICKKI